MPRTKNVDDRIADEETGEIIGYAAPVDAIGVDEALGVRMTNAVESAVAKIDDVFDASEREPTSRRVKSDPRIDEPAEPMMLVNGKLRTAEEIETEIRRLVEVKSAGPIQADDAVDLTGARIFNARSHARQLRGRAGGQGEYLDVKWRLVWFRLEHPEGSIASELVELSDKHAVFKTTVSFMTADGRHVSTTGYGSETIGDFADYIEKAETKSIGRALNHAGYGAQFMPDDAVIDSSPVERPGTGDGNASVSANNGSPRDERPPQRMQGSNAEQASAQGENRERDAEAVERIKRLRAALVQHRDRVGASPEQLNAIVVELVGDKRPEQLTETDLRAIIENLAQTKSGAYAAATTDAY